MTTTDQLAAIEARANDPFGTVLTGLDQVDADRDALLALVREQRAALERVRAIPPIEYGVDDNHHFPNGYNAAIAGVRAALTATEEPADSHHVRCNAHPDHEGACSWPVFAAITATEAKP